MIPLHETVVQVCIYYSIASEIHFLRLLFMGASGLHSHPYRGGLRQDPGRVRAGRGGKGPLRGVPAQG